MKIDKRDGKFKFPGSINIKQKQKEIIAEFKNRNSNQLMKFYAPISKLHQATFDDFIKIAEQIKLFDEDMSHKVSNKLLERLFNDIEKMKPWKCTKCWFMNRKMMIGGLWRLYNQINECGLCGKERDKSKQSKKWNEEKKSDGKLFESLEVEFRLPENLAKEWKSVEALTCSIVKYENNHHESQQYLESWTVDKMIQFVRNWIKEKNDNNINLRQNAIINYFEDNGFDGKKFLKIKRRMFIAEIKKKLGIKSLTAKLLKLHEKITKIGIDCKAMKRIAIILKHYHLLTKKLNETNNRYPYLIRQFLSELTKHTRSQLLDDFDHILDHELFVRQQQPYIEKCEKGNECIHLKRAKRSNKCASTLKEKQDLFNCYDWRDFVYISYLDKIHCALLHLHDGDDGDINSDVIKQDKDTIHRYSKFSVYSTGIYVDHAALSPLHFNLKQELLNNNVYTMKENDFENSVQEAQNIYIMNKKRMKKLIAKETNEIYGIKIGDTIQIEHILVIYLYCSNSELCRTFRESYRSQNEFEASNNNQNVRRYHINNFYLFGRFIFEGIQFFGEKPGKKEIFYHGQRKQFLFNEFSTILETPTSTTPDWGIAQRLFAGDNGIVLKLAPKFKNELNNNKYLNVSTISNYNDEDERLFAGMTVLAVIDVGYSQGNIWRWLDKYALGFLYFERIIQQTIHNKNYYNYGFVSKSIQKKYLLPLIIHQINRNKSNNKNNKRNAENYKANEYLYALFEHFCDSKRDYINLTCINDELNQMDDSIQNILFKKNNDNQFEINNQSIKLIFPKLKGYKNHLGYWITF